MMLMIYLGIAYDFEISGTSDKAKEGEEVYLEFKAIPVNKKFKYFNYTIVKKGRCRYKLIP